MTFDIFDNWNTNDIIINYIINYDKLSLWINSLTKI